MEGMTSDHAVLLDAGCNAGGLIRYLQTIFPKFRFVGIDIELDLIIESKRRISSALFLVGSVLKLPFSRNRRFDFIVSSGMLPIFDIEELHDFFANLFSCIKDGGKVFLFNNFNNYPVDLMIRHRKWRDKKTGEWEKGWNVYSKKTINEILKNDFQVKSYGYHDFTMPFALEPQSDPVRTWTICTAENPHQLVNGLNLLVNLSCLEILV
jgi:cyclopropane fatty-acyl-phospholipid synthase-like methyltransferase